MRMVFVVRAWYGRCMLILACMPVGQSFCGAARVLAGVPPRTTGATGADVLGCGHTEPSHAEEGTRQKQGSSASSCLPAGMVPILSNKHLTCLFTLL